MTNLTYSTGTAKEKEEETRQSRDLWFCVNVSTESCVNNIYYKIVHVVQNNEKKNTQDNQK